MSKHGLAMQIAYIATKEEYNQMNLKRPEQIIGWTINSGSSSNLVLVVHSYFVRNCQYFITCWQWQRQDPDRGVWAWGVENFLFVGYSTFALFCNIEHYSDERGPWPNDDLAPPLVVGPNLRNIDLIFRHAGSAHRAGKRDALPGTPKGRGPGPGTSSIILLV